MANDGSGDKVPDVMRIDLTLRLASSLIAKAGAKHQYDMVRPPANPPPVFALTFVTCTRYDFDRASANISVPEP